MARYTDAKCKLCRREGQKLYLKGKRCSTTKCPIERKGAVPPGERPKRRPSRLSDYGVRLREKQRLKRYYGVLEAQFRRYLRKAEKSGDDVGTVLLRLLETRLDNVVHKLGFCWSKNQSRQLIRHGHVLVDGRKVDIPSYNIKQGQVVSLSAKAQGLSAVQEARDQIPNEAVPKWLERKGLVGKVKRLPDEEELEGNFDVSLIVEYYSR